MSEKLSGLIWASIICVLIATIIHQNSPTKKLTVITYGIYTFVSDMYKWTMKKQ